jgi:hypothetical protein
MISIHYMAFPIFSILTGIMILIFPTLLNYVVAIYLIMIGIAGLLGTRVG